MGKHSHFHLNEVLISLEPTCSACVETMTHGKFMEKLNKTDKLLQQFPHGIRAADLAEKLGVHRTQVYDYLNSLRIREKARSEDGLWFPKQSSSKQKKATASAYPLQERIRLFRKEMVEIKHEYANGYASRAYTKAKLLWLSLDASFKKELGPSFKTVETELERIVREKYDPFERTRDKLTLFEKVVPYLIEKLSEVERKMEQERSQ